MATRTNRAGLTKQQYRGAPSTLCQGCGHNSIASQIIAAAYELDIVPENIVKFSGIGCSSKSPTYFLSRSFGFNGLHGRMPSLATGALLADVSLKGMGVSGDGDTASIGMGQFKYVVRRNLDMVYIVENNGVYGLTKGQFSATAEKGLTLKKQGTNPYMPVDICMEAVIGGASFVARSFAGDPKQVKELLKAAIQHKGLAIIDIISPCVSFNNREGSYHSYSWGKAHETPIHDISFVPSREEIILKEAFEPGEIKDVTLHDGSHILLKKLDRDYDPTSRVDAIQILDENYRNNLLLTGLIYINPGQPTLADIHNLPDYALNRLTEKDLRPSPETLEAINAQMF
ncbi:MAG TPA: 2-oxoacid:ferredoxin oxidoreductase subunit beta [Chloroflexi bacterium]|nr:2-oxoacid:ferredoxin oxidoreductase subunit beta [Chloroflexota bacterium]